MKTKKSPNADLEKRRPMLLMLGLVLSLGMILAAFSWETPVRQGLVFGSPSVEPDFNDFVIPRTEPEPPKPAPKPILLVNVLATIDEGADELDPNAFDSEIKQGQAIEISPVVYNRPEETGESTVICQFPQQMPEFPGGMSALISFINKTVKYPALAQEVGTQGRVFVRFVVNTDGTISDAVVVRSVDESLDQEAIRVVKNMPRWKPGMQNGKPVRVSYHIPINFVLQ